MSLTIVSAVAINGIIGNSALKRMPWKVSEELQFFKKNTMGKVIVMGRKTAEETGNLPGRDCIVLSKDPTYKLDGFATMTIEQLLVMNELNLDKEYAICGGAEIYKQLIPYASFALISWMDFEAHGDILMPALDRDAWRKVSSVEMKQFTATSYFNTSRKIYNTIVSHSLLNKTKKRGSRNVNNSGKAKERPKL